MNTTTLSPLLQIEGLEMRFGELAVLRGVNATFTTGQITAIIGPNGAGKTTLFHAITGDLRPERGLVSFSGRSLIGLPPWRIARLGIGKMFQDVRLFSELTVIENVLLALHENGGRSLTASLLQVLRRHRQDSVEKDKAADFLRMIGVEEPWNRAANSLSFGNQKLLALTRLVAGDFKLLLLDEPTAGVSPPLVERMAAILLNLVNERRASVALIEHNFSFVEQIASHAYLLRDGEIMDGGPAHEVLEKEENKEVLIGL